MAREELMLRIQEKKKAVGAGYLTDQGALFLVAGELGVSLRKDESVSDLTIKDLYIGANDVTVAARVLAVYPVATFNKKDGGIGKYRRLALFDGKQTARITVWEEGIEPLEALDLAADAAVRVVSGYVKQGLDGKPNLNLGKRGRIEVVTEEKVLAKLPKLAAATERLAKLSQEKQFVALELVVSSEPRYSEFVRSDGSPGSLFQFGAGVDGGEVRIVVWSPVAKPELKRGDRVVVTNVRARRSSSGEFEVHGDAGSAILLGQRAEKTKLRVVATPSGEGRGLLAIDASGRVKVLELGKEAGAFRVGELLAVAPDRESGGRLYCESAGSVEAGADSSFPELGTLSTKLREVKGEGSMILVEAIALSQGSVDDVHLIDGSTARKGELLLGDDTGEVKLVAWREASDKVSGIQPGERLRIVGAAPKVTKMGAWVLEATRVTVVERLRGQT